MDLLVNDLSIHEQFHDIPTFRNALSRLMAMRGVARHFGREVHCHRAFLTANPIPDVPMQQAIGRLADRNKQRAAIDWLTRAGPFWDDLRQHAAGDWLECEGEIVTDTAVGEAAFRTLHDVECGLVSATPSDWDCSSVDVFWRREDEGLDDKAATIKNWRDADALEEELRNAALPIQSWDDLREASTNRFESLTIAGNCFTPLNGVPFSKSSADRIFVLLKILDRLARAFDTDGVRTPEGHKIYRDYFTGDGAWFSDSSKTEKNDFCNEMMFPHPDNPEDSLCCTWHGKVRHKTLRLHFSWPIEAGRPVYIVYAGPKITKR